MDEAALRRAMEHYVRTTVGRYSIGDVLYRLTDQCVEIIGCDGAGVSVTDDEGRLRFVTATDDAVTPIEERQVQLQQGPCHDAFASREQVVVGDIAEERERWPEYCRVAEAQGCHAVIGVPMGVDDTAIGALNIYRHAPHSWTRDEMRAGQLLADMAAGYIANLQQLSTSQRLADQLRHALDSRVVIEQAKGAIAVTHDVDAPTAFDMLRKHARREQRRVHDVAREVVDGTLRL